MTFQIYAARYTKHVHEHYTVSQPMNGIKIHVRKWGYWKKDNKQQVGGIFKSQSLHCEISTKNIIVLREYLLFF